MNLRRYTDARVLPLLVILALSFAVRGLTAYFIHEHLSDPGWFQSGTYTHFDTRARDILDGKASVFWIDNPLHTETAIYPPGYSLWLAFIYQLTGDRSAASVQRVQWVLDSLSVLLIVGISATAYDWRVAFAAGFLGALSPLLALSGAVPLADAPASWFVLSGVWLLLVSIKRKNLLLALTAGALVGVSCWLRGNALLLPLFWAVTLLFVKDNWPRRISLSATVLLGMALIVAPLLVRNAVAFRVFTPTGLGMGTNLWEGIGETDRAAEFGAVFGDRALLEQERVQLGIPPDAPFGLYYPDGVKRDRERARKAIAVIRAHPVWYAGVMLRRMAGVLKFAGTPAPHYGSAGINVTGKKCLPANLQGGVLSWFVTALGMMQSVIRYSALPLMIVGISFAFKQDWRLALLLLSTVFYYLVIGSALHTEIRYGLPMQALLFIFAGLAISELIDFV
jgi:4-amino-4-deoxy-L-arabinose transferase-like glycosyltransferase